MFGFSILYLFALYGALMVEIVVQKLLKAFA